MKLETRLSRRREKVVVYHRKSANGSLEKRSIFVARHVYYGLYMLSAPLVTHEEMVNKNKPRCEIDFLGNVDEIKLDWNRSCCV